MMRESRIGDFCVTGSGTTPSRSQADRYYTDGTIPWIKSGELRENTITCTEEHVTDFALKETSLKLIPAGALLLAMYGATVGRLGILGVQATTNQAVCHIVPEPELADVRFLFHAIQAKLSILLSRTVGGAQPNINQGIVNDLRVPLPPLPEQRRIAAILDQADALRAKRREAIEKLDTLTHATFLEMFGDPVSNPKGFPAGTIEDLVRDQKRDVKCGPFGTQLKVAEIVDSGVPLIGIENVLDGNFRGDTKKFLTGAKAKELGGFDIAPGDVLVTRMGTIGRSCVVPSEFLVGRFSYHLFRIRPDQSKCLPGFLAATISKSGTFQAQLRAQAHGAIMDGLSTSNLKSVRFLVPPISLQHEFVKRIEALERLRGVQLASLAKLDELFASLQHRAFRGELTSGDIEGFEQAADEIPAIAGVTV